MIPHFHRTLLEFYENLYPSDISYQSEIISDNDLLPEKDYSTMKINSADNVESVVAHGITDVSDMKQDTLQMPEKSCHVSMNY
jgi:hypothetical protein